MRKLCLLFFMVISAGDYIYTAPVKPIEVSFYGDINKKLTYLFDPSNRSRLFPRPRKKIVVTSPGKVVYPSTGFRYKKYYVGTAPYMTLYGEYRVLTIGDKGKPKFRIRAFRRNGKNECAFVKGADNQLWAQFPDNSIKKIGTTKRGPVPGSAVYKDIHKLKGKSSGWITCHQHKILEQKKNNSFKQIGWVAWREVFLDGKKIVLLMTKRISSKAPWTGRYKDILIVDNINLSIPVVAVQKKIYPVQKSNIPAVTFNFIDLFEAKDQKSKRNFHPPFISSRTHCIWTIVSVKNLLYKKQFHSHDVKWTWYKNDGTVIATVVSRFNIKPEWKDAHIERGWGNKVPGIAWKPGKYYITIHFDGRLVKTHHFTIMK